MFIYSFSNPEAFATSSGTAANQNATAPERPSEEVRNLTSSVDLSSGIIQFARSTVNHSLSEASTIATDLLGPDSFVYSASLDSQDGYLIYRVFALDANDRAHLVLIDPGNGSLIDEIPLGKVLRPFS